MKLGAAVSIMILGGVMLVACATEHPYRTSPLSSPVSVSILATPVSTQSKPCIEPERLQAYVNKEVCMEGTVLSTENSGNNFVMWFGEDKKEAYVTVQSTFYLGVEGKCLRIEGMIQKDSEGNVFIRADDPGQVSSCKFK